MSADNPQPADGGELSIDQAVGLLGAMDEPEKRDDAPADEAESKDTEGEDSQPEETAGAETPTGEQEDGEEEQEQELPAIEAPRSWNREAKARFAELPRDVQETIVSRESERETALSKAHQDAAEARKKAESETSTFAQYKAVLDQLLPQAAQTFKSRWDGVDWAKVTETLGADQALKLKFQHDQEREQLQRLEAAQQASIALNQRNFIAAEFEKLKTISPELSDPKEGPTKRSAVGKFLLEQGVPETDLKNISALALSLAYDAMRYREAQKGIVPKKPASQPAKSAAVKPTSARGSVNPQKQAAAAARDRLFRTGSIDDAVAYLNAKGNA